MTVGELHSLVDMLKKTMYFCEGLTVKELTRFVHNKMLQDYEVGEVKECIESCLKQIRCFTSNDGWTWHLDRNGEPENDRYYDQLFKQQRALRFAQPSTKGNKKNKKRNGETVNLMHDGRFVQLEGGKWGLTEWEIDPAQYRLRHLVIKVLFRNPDGLLPDEVVDKVEIFREVRPNAVFDLLKKYPYFVVSEDGRWQYRPELRKVYDLQLERHLISLNREKRRFFREKDKLLQKIKYKEMQLREVKAAKEQVAAALAERTQMLDDYDHLVQRFAEKDLLLSLRKKELIRCRQERARLESKANSILHQCRRWVDKARGQEEEIAWLKEQVDNLSAQVEWVQEKDRQLQKKLADLKDKYTTEKAELVRENLTLKHQLEKGIVNARREEKELREELAKLSNDLRQALQLAEERRYSLEATQEQLEQYRKECRMLKASTRHPLVRLSMKIAAIFGG